SVELVDFRPVEDAPVEIRPAKVDIVDWRNDDRPAPALLAACNFPHLTWAEAAHKTETGGADRTALSPAETLVLWTTPPTPAHLRAALQQVRPRRVVLVCRDPGADDPRAFLERLTGLVKYILNQRGGQTSLPTLAAATAQSEAAVLAGLDWLSQRGQIAVQRDSSDTLRLQAATALPDDPSAAQTMQRLTLLLRESAAYRAYLRRANAEAILRFSPENS
ncbi:MAG: hypothetical protein WHV44_17135, partial [Anaerolineales bacterium]